MSRFGKVAVLLGGSSAEREVSLKSGEAVLNALLQAGVDALAFDPAERDLWELKNLAIERVFIALHGRGGEDGTIQGALEYMGIPYTGSGVLGSALAMDKVRCKRLFQSAKLSTAAYTVIDANTGFDAQSIINEFGKVMVKPSHEGSSIGMAQASNAQELNVALTHAFKFDDQVLVEQWITGPEFTVAMLGGEALPVIEMKTPRGFYDYEAKYQVNSTQYFCPADISNAYASQLQVMSKHAFELVGAKGWGRVDAMQDDNGQFYLLEVNTVPGMTQKSLVPMAAKAQGISFEQLVVRILEQTL
ncbi:D-alanine--D-alanine ligase [Pseudoalteromonas holothuriae]|uniref:D-alanine--D-alanine ligase n=1 Tax=Pseudoalteromonas holothuriae TaxID=2963714 RepID=A0A9W4R2J2_9GAMM|nr:MULTISPECIES: D-alanine--D-alanine ligase [unclassified Pseudoalteromonas]CAH9063544.1 D-alanine--D-alanine ligase [Pseudoalteromonas sp. CIP111854]CAH9064827.1 D-alanine--D-alanine ligase [Pseudoalteromonas sp. CIP111951]